MKFPFLASLVVFVLWLSYEIHKAKTKENDKLEEYLDKEARANSTRRKSLDDLAYVKIPLEALPFHTLSEDDGVQDYQRIIKELSEEPIVNLSGISNTDLKLMYGVANLETLSRYDQAYMTLIRTLQQWANHLFDRRFTAEAKILLEYAIQIGSDISGTYKLLASIYNEEGNMEGILDLIAKAKELDSPMKQSILKNLDTYL